MDECKCLGILQMVEHCSCPFPASLHLTLCARCGVSGDIVTLRSEHSILTIGWAQCC